MRPTKDPTQRFDAFTSAPPEEFEAEETRQVTGVGAVGVARGEDATDAGGDVEAVNYGVYLVGGEAAGLLCRVQRGPTDRGAVTVPALIDPAPAPGEANHGE